MRNKKAAITKSKMKLKGTLETNNYVTKCGGVNRSTRTGAGVIIWIRKSSKTLLLTTLTGVKE